MTRNVRLWSSLVAICALLAVGCPGQKPPATPPAQKAQDKPDGPVQWKLSKSGLGFRLSNADDEADNPPERKVAPATPLGADDAKRMAARLPELKKDPDDEKDFAMRAKSIPAPRPGKTIVEQFPPPAGPPPVSVASPGPLKVERKAPEGPVELAPHLTMTFSQPMVGITSLDELGKEGKPVKLTPEPPGKWRWLGTKTLMFQPEKRFPMATEYVVEVPAGTRSTSGGALAQMERWTFTTPPPVMKRHHPGGSSEPREPIMFVEFDQAIEPKAMLSSVELSSGKGAVPIRLAEPDEIEANDAARRLMQHAEKGRWIAFKPVDKLPTATSFSVRVKAGAPSAEGPRRTDKEQAYSFSTYGPLKVVRSQCSHWVRGKEVCPPLQPWYIQFSNPIDLKTFDKKLVSITPEIPGAKIEVHGQGMTISGKSKGRTKYTVKIDGAIGDVHGQTMGEPATIPFDVGSAEPVMFGAESEMIVLDPASPKQYLVYSINEPQLRARVYAVGPEDWKRYIAYHNEWERPRKIAPPGKLVSDKMLTPKKAPDELVATPIDLAPALQSGLGQVFISVEPTRPLPKGHRHPELMVWLQSTEIGLDAMVEADQVTGWATKLSDGTPVDGVDVQLIGMKKDADEPPALKLDTIISQGKTDAQGLAKVPLNDMRGRLIIGRKGKDTVLVPEHWFGDASYSKRATIDALRWLVFDDRGMYKPGEEIRIKGWIRKSGTGRGGDIDGVPSINGKTVNWSLRDPRGAEVGKGTATVDDHGGFDLAMKTPNNINTGRASLSLSVNLGGFHNTSAHHSISIQEFRRPEFEVSARSSEGPHYVGKFAIATLNAAYYSGGGLPNAPVTWHVNRSTVNFTPPNRNDFHFGPEIDYFWSWRQKPNQAKSETWTARTNALGVHRLRVDFDALDPSYPMDLEFSGTVEDVNRQAWAGHTSMLVHPADAYVGIKSAKNFVRAGEPIDLEIVVTDVDGKAMGGRHVVVKAARMDWEQKGTEYEEKEVDIQTCEVDSPKDPTPERERMRCALKTTQGGAWKVWAVVTDAHGRKNQTAQRVYVMGENNPKDRALERAKATVVLDKKEYKPGELAEVLVVAPFTPAEAILTVRRQGIVHLERFSMKSTSHALKVKLDDAYVPNVSVRVDLVGQDLRNDPSGEPDPKLPKRPAFAVGTAEAKILPTARTLSVKAEPKKAALEPGGTTEIEVDVKDDVGRGVKDAQVALIVVDESVLALSGYKTPDPVAFFYSHRGPDVHDLGMRDRVHLADPDFTHLARLADDEMMDRDGAPGGSFGRLGGMHKSAAMAEAAPMTQAAPPPPPAPMRLEEKSKERADKKSDAPAEPEKSVSNETKAIQLRSDFNALALFSPKLASDKDGRATVKVKLPDNLTRYRVMAIAAAEGKRFGSKESTITARLPVMVRPSAPRFLNFGDKFELPVVVQNQTDQPVDVGIVVRATNATVEEGGKRIKVAPNDRVEVRFNAGTVKPGTARFQFGIASGSFSDASSIELPVYTPATTEAFATYGEIDEGAIAQPVKMPPNVFPQFGGLEVTTSSTQLQALTDAVIYLVKYPFECNEQLSSRVLAIAALRDVLTAFKSKDLPPPEAMQASMKSDFEKLKRRQHYNGGWGFWQEEPWPYLTVHVAHALVRAKEKGYKPDEQMLSRAQQYMRSIESHIPHWYGEDARRALIAYSIFVRHRMGDKDVTKTKRLIAEAGGVEKLPIEAVGWIWPLVSEDKSMTTENEAIRRHITNRTTETAGAAHFVSGYKDSDWVLLHSDRRADGIILESMIGDQQTNSVIPKLVKGLLGHRKAGRWGNTQENAFVLLALDRYFHTYEKVTPDFVAKVWLGDKYAGDHAFKGRTTEYSHIGIPMQYLADSKAPAQNLTLVKDGPGRMYYRIGMQYAPTDLKLPPADAGFVVSRLYEGADKPEDVKRDPDGTWRVKAGAKVRIRVSMVAPSRRYHVALVDPLPAGLEPMNPALAVTGAIPKDPKASETSKNRYWYWSRTWYEHQNMRDERVEAFTSLLWDGVWDYTYVARATTPGTFVVPPAKAEEMYSPETFGRSAGDRMIIE